jgi:uncharacterized protein YwgA
MTRNKRQAILAELAARLRRAGSWCGETHIQKAVYLSQELLGVRTGFEFVLYKHGPFSFDLRDALGQMRSEGMLSLEYRPHPYGPSFRVPDDQLVEIERRFPLTLKRFGKRIDFVATQLGPFKVSQLEQLATAMYVLRECPGEPPRVRSSRLRAIKPHVSDEDATWAVQLVDEMAVASSGVHVAGGQSSLA